MSDSGTRYYWCVNCGYHGDYGKVKKRNLTCEKCQYTKIAYYEYLEIVEDGDMELDTFKLVKKGE